MRVIVVFVALLTLVAGLAFSASAVEGEQLSGGPDDEKNAPLALLKRVEEALSKGECDKIYAMRDEFQGDALRTEIFFVFIYHNSEQCFPKYPEKSFSIIKEAAGKGYFLTEYFLGYMYLKGIGTPKDEGKASYWFKKNALLLAGFSDNKSRVSFLEFTFGEPGIPDVLIKELKWIKKVEEGDPEQLYDLALRIRDGEGLPKDCRMADRWMTKASLSKLPKALYEYGKWMLEGICVKINVKMGLGWMSQAAEAGYVKAQKYLGSRSASQKPSKDSNIAAHYWLRRAQSLGANVKDILQKVEALMTEEEKKIANYYYGKGVAPPPLK